MNKLDELYEINTKVNRYPGAVDKEVFGKVDYMQRISIVGKGDCEDYVAEKYALLKEAGWPTDKMGPVSCVAPDGSGHAVLLVKLDNELLVLDNLSHWIVNYLKTPYTWDYIPAYLLET